MKILRKLIIIFLAAIVIVAIAAAVLVNFLAERGVKYAIETAGTKALNVGVSVDDVDLSITRGKLILRGVSVKNPPGYQHDKLLKLDTAEIEIDVRSLLSDVVKIKAIKLDGAVVVVEQKLGRNNLQDVLKAIPRGPKAEGQATPEGKKLHIDLLEITNTTVKAKLLPLPGRADTISLKLDPIRMTNLGSDNKLTTATLMGKIFSAIGRGVAEKGAGVLPDEIVGGLSQVLGMGFDLGKGILKGGADIGKKVIKGVGDIGKGIGNSLFKPKDKDEDN